MPWPRSIFVTVITAFAFALWMSQPFAARHPVDLAEAPPAATTAEITAARLADSTTGETQRTTIAAVVGGLSRSGGTFDPHAHEQLRLRIVDVHGRPIAGAEVCATGLRSKAHPGSHFRWRDAPPHAISDAHGEATLSFPVWASERAATSRVTIQVDHREFIPNGAEVGVAPSVHEVTLERGALISVSGWVGDPSTLVTEVEPRVTDSARVRNSDWQYPVGRPPSTHRMAFGEHALYLTHRCDAGVFHSGIHEFQVTPTTRKHIRLELKPAVTLRGRLGDNVPRPIRNGSVHLNLSVDLSSTQMSRAFSAQVTPDGQFELPGLPIGTGEIVGACDGWTSVSTLPPCEHEALRSHLRPKPQSVDVSDVPAEMVLAMQPASALTIQATDPDGKPAVGVEFRLSANVLWRHGHAEPFMRRRLRTLTDENGLAVFTELPAGRLDCTVASSPLRLPWRKQGERSVRNIRLELVSGTHHETEVRLTRE